MPAKYSGAHLLYVDKGKKQQNGAFILHFMVFFKHEHVCIKQNGLCLKLKSTDKKK